MTAQTLDGQLSPDPSTASDPPTVRPGRCMMPTPRIVIIEGCLNLGLLYTDEFQDLGYGVRVFQNFDQALLNPDQSVVDLVLADGGCSQSDAVRIVGELRGGFPHAGLVIVTAATMPTTAQETVGAEALIAKSSDLTELKHAVSAALASTSSRPKVPKQIS